MYITIWCCTIIPSCYITTAFVLPPTTTHVSTSIANNNDASSSKYKLRSPFTTTSLSSTTTASTIDDDTSSTTSSTYKYTNYNKPIVLIGLSSSPQNNELQSLALSLSTSLVGNNSKMMGDILNKLERSQAGGLLNDDDDDDSSGSESVNSSDKQTSKKEQQQVSGISLSAIGLDTEGPFVLDSTLIRELITQQTLTLTSGVIVLDFNHEAFQTKEYEVDLIRAMGSIAKTLYEEDGLLCVYVNIDSTDMSNDVQERKRSIENEILIPFSDYEICMKDEGIVTSNSKEQQEGVMNWSDIQWELFRITSRALLIPPTVGQTANPSSNNNADILMGLNTFFLSLSFPHVTESTPYIERMCADVDSMEYRVDLLDVAKDYLSSDDDDDSVDEGGEVCKSSKENARFDILYQQQQLRALCRPYAQRAPSLPVAGGSGIIDDALPIVYTVRTANQAGTWPDDEEGIKAMFDLLELGLRSGVEVLDIESAWDAKLTDKLLAKAQSRYTSLILGSHHVVGTQVSMDEAIELYRQCRMKNRAHGAKVVLSITSNDNDEDQLAYKAAIEASKLDTPEIPNIGLILGEMGSYSRILNERFTPVTHESLPSVAAPGQLTAAEIMAGRMLTGLIPTQRYAILGHNIAYSVSPQMQGSAFVAVKLPHTYTRADVETVEEFIEGPIWNDDNFGGCSVTIPHKQNIIPHLDVLTDAAKEIGSVNTVIVKKDKFGTRVLIGENTDWRGIYNPLQRRLGDDIADDKKKDTDATTQYALILGGGGTARAAAYAASKLGLERIYFNRTPEKAQDLANEFGGVVASNLWQCTESEDSLGSILNQNNGNVKVVISTLPAGAEFELPEWMLEVTKLPVVFDVNYKPYNTKLLLQATSQGCDVVRGSEMLWEQGVGQFELWTGRTAPYGVMKKVVLENCLPKEEDK